MHSLGTLMAVGDHNTFVLQKIAHARPTRQHELRHIFDDLRLVLGREQCREPLCQALEYSSVWLFFLGEKSPGGEYEYEYADVPLCPAARAE